MKKGDLSIKGVNYYRLLYPGRLKLNSGVAYQVPIEGSTALIFLKRVMLSCAILDHANALVKVRRNGAQFTFLERPIAHRPTNTISADFTSVYSQATHTFVFTKELDYTTYSTKPFTEILIGIESKSDCTRSAPEDRKFCEVLDRFIHLYRAMTGDVRAQPIDAIQIDEPVVFWAFVKYGPTDAPLTPVERINVNWPKTFQPWFVSLREYANKAAPDEEPPLPDSKKFADYLVSGVTPSEPQKALLDCLEVLNRTHRARYAVIESFSIAELVWNQMFEKLSAHDSKLKKRIDSKRRDHNSIPAKSAINSVLPQIFSNSTDADSNFFRRLNQVREKRVKIVHRGYGCDGDFAEVAIQTVQEVINRAVISLSQYGEELV